MSDPFKKVRRGIRRGFKSIINIPRRVIQNTIDVVRGKKPIDDAVKNSLRVTVRAFRDTAAVAAEMDRLLQTVTVKLAATLGDDAAAIMADVNRVSRLTTDPALSVATLESLDRFIDTGDVAYLNPLSIIAAREVTASRDLLWDRAHPVPSDVLDALPTEVDRMADGVRFMLVSQVPGNTNWPAIAVRHADQSAITLINLIVYKDMPPMTDDGLHLWCHELLHVKQYGDSVADFTSRYMAGELRRATRSDKNRMEVEADRFACGFFPNGHAAYLPGGRCS